jgi:site-specific DNA recombinase
MNRKIIRCAVYTRKSSEEGLEQDFNSLDAQRESGEAYIKSQKHEGWELITEKYDDGGYSGGNMERPGLKKLMDDIAASKIDIVVVYKVDRLSRALSDFAKMVDVFDKHNVSFISVTQAFNTTTSMGRLTLNVLLSFAQFEREVTGERIRDKFAASKKKGMWMGGIPPLGYDIKDRKLIINKKEAEIVKYIFEYITNRSDERTLPILLEGLKTKGYKNKSWTSATGNKIIGKDFNLARIYKLINNPVYIGKIAHKGQIYDGEHESIIPQELWNLAKSKIIGIKRSRSKIKKSEQPKLVGKIFDYMGNKMTASYSYKYSDNGRYKMRYYINREIIKLGNTNSEFRRIRAEHIDDIVLNTVSSVLENLINGISNSTDAALTTSLLKYLHHLKFEPEEFISKIILYPQYIEFLLSINCKNIALNHDQMIEIEQILQPLNYKNLELKLTSEGILQIKFNLETQYKKFGKGSKIIFSSFNNQNKIQKQPHYNEDKTFIFIAKSFYFNKIGAEATAVSPLKISNELGENIEYVKRALRQKYLSPKIIEAIVNYKSNTISYKQIGVEQLSKISHWCWESQERIYLKP